MSNQNQALNRSLGQSPDYTHDQTREQLIAMQQKSNVVKEKANGFVEEVKNKVFSLATLRSLSLYRFSFYQPRSGHNYALSYLANFFKNYEISMFDFGCKVKNIHMFSKMSDYRLAVKDGVYFFLIVQEEDLMTKEVVSVYVPMWQRKKAKKILQSYFLENRPRGNFVSDKNGVTNRTSTIDKRLGTNRQFVRKEVYDYVDKIFQRMINNKEWYIKEGKRFKETFMLHGDPGTGKTTLYLHMSSKYRLNVARFTPRAFVEAFDWILEYAESDDRIPLVVLIEDLDAEQELLMPEYRNKTMIDAPTDGDFNYSIFINCLDGAEALHNVIVCTSTNYKDRIIPSVVRPGRVDHSIELSSFNSQEIAEEVGGEFQEHIASFPDGTFSISSIIDLRNCITIEDIDEKAKWLKEDVKH